MFTLQKFIAALLFIFIFFIPGVVFGQIENPDGELKKASSDEIWAQTMQGRNFNEFWSYHFYLNDSLKVHATFSVANFGRFKAPVSGLRLTVLNLDDNVLYQVSREYPLDILIQNKSSYTFKMHPDREVYFKGKLPDEHEVRINTSKNGVTYDIHLTFENIANGYRWDQGKFNIGNEEIGIITHIPYAEVKGYVSVNEHKKKVKGTAYMDHTFQNQTISRLMHSGYRFIYHEDADNWDILYFLYPSARDNKTIGYRLTNRNNCIKLQGTQEIKDITRSRSFQNTLAQDIELELDNKKTIKLSRSSDEEMFSVFEELGWVQRRAARAFLGGEVLDFRGEAILTEPNKKPKKGNYNFFKVD
ncbi:MAG: hypothetical protein WD098_01435 [Balneolales bacterium]